MIALVLAAVLAQADAGTPDAGAANSGEDAGIYRLCPERVPTVEMDGGRFVPDQQGRRLNCIMDACDFRVRQLESVIVTDTPPPSWAYWTAGVLIVGGVGLTVGYVCGKIPSCGPF